LIRQEALRLERLYFGARARRRARLKRIARWVSYFSIAAVLLGIPGSMMAVELVNSFIGSSGPQVTTAAEIETSESAASTLRFQRKVVSVRPTPDPSPKSESPDEPDSITEIIYAAAAEHGLDGGYLLSVADCESSLNPYAVNAAGYYGLFQFDEQTWGAYGYGSIYDPVAQAQTAAELIAAGQSSRWPNCA
jgi:soluble lytic murein transglycosylase-like protein